MSTPRQSMTFGYSVRLESVDHLEQVFKNVGMTRVGVYRLLEALHIPMIQFPDGSRWFNWYLFLVAMSDLTRIGGFNAHSPGLVGQPSKRSRTIKEAVGSEEERARRLRTVLGQMWVSRRLARTSTKHEQDQKVNDAVRIMVNLLNQVDTTIGRRVESEMASEPLLEAALETMALDDETFEAVIEGQPHDTEDTPPEAPA